ncbi:MAG: zinc-ribbon domain-containing protein [Ruminococcus sp.]|nr:zinc-ribbon domain-containing protein [Ruminococcus sp.]
MICPNCGVEVKESEQICPLCGFAFEHSMEVSSVEQETTNSPSSMPK